VPRRCIFGHSGSPLSSLPKTARCSNPAVEMEFVEEFQIFEQKSEIDFRHQHFTAARAAPVLTRSRCGNIANLFL
jgi:hypothetical protein